MYTVCGGECYGEKRNSEECQAFGNFQNRVVKEGLTEKMAYE